MSTTLAGEPQPKANGKATHSERRRVGDTVAPPIPDWKHPQAVFDYKDARGNLLYQNVRFPLVTDGSPVLSSNGKPDKTFRLRRPNKKGGWVGDFDDVAQVPYRLPDLVKALVDGATVFIPEGEAKVDALLEWSVPATHIATGTKDYAKLFCEADVILMPDNDAAGWSQHGRSGASRYCQAHPRADVAGVAGQRRHYRLGRGWWHRRETAGAGGAGTGLDAARRRGPSRGRREDR
jgi:hypothetical protein